MIDENFDANHYDWRIDDENDFSTKIDDGEYILKVNDEKNNKWTLKSTSLDGSNENFQIETALELKSGPENSGYGIVFGMYNDNSNYKVFYLANTGYYKMVHHFANESHKTIDWKKTSLIKKGMNKIVIKRNFNCVQFWLNDVLIETHCEWYWWGDKIGFIAAEKQKVAVDYIKITASPKKMSVTDNSMAQFKKENLGTLVNSKYHENSPVIAPDGKTLYYCVYYSPENTADKNATDIYYSELQPGQTWDKYKNIGPPLNNNVSNWVVSVSPDNNSLVVGNHYKADGSPNGGGISIAYRDKDNKWQVPVDQEIKDYNNLNRYTSYYISSDNKVLLIGMQDVDSYGDQDIYVSFRESESHWSKPMNIGNGVNTVCSDFGPFLAADGKTLYFASYGNESYGSSDIFMTKRLDDTWKNWTKPVNLGPSINSTGWESGFSISAKGDYAYMISEDDVDGATPDIFRIKLSETQKPQPVLLVYGKVLNKKTNQPLASTISYSDLTANKEIGVASSNAVDGSYKIILPMGKDYGFLAAKEGFYPIAENIKLDTLKEYMEIERNLYLAPVEVGETIRLNNIFFDLNKSTLKTESSSELDRLVDFLKNNPAIKIEVAGHTDNVGSDEYNLKLSQQRTESVTAYLAEKGIEKSRLTARGYGETKPVESNESEEGRAMNRRVEFSIQSK